MAENSKIEWCDHTFNPWWGCQKVSPACDNCYAEALDKRTGGDHWGPKAPRRRTGHANWNKPLKWNKDAAAKGIRYRVFCASMADVFDNQVPPEWRDDLWMLIKATPHLDWLLLTKRPQNIKKMLPADWGNGYPNVWLMTTAENQPEAERRIKELLAVPAVIHGLSMEPLLGPVDFSEAVPSDHRPHGPGRSALSQFDYCEDCGEDDGLPKIDWVICGGESGPGARPMHPDWARSLRDQCAAADVPFFFKQWGEFLPVGQTLPGYGKVHGATAVKMGRMKLHYGGGGPARPIMHAFAERGVEFTATDDGRLTFRVGKKAAGRLLDGCEHNEFPNLKERSHHHGRISQ